MNFQAIREAIQVFAGKVYETNITEVPEVVLDWVRAHPGQASLMIVNGALVFTPAALTGPLLASMGFGQAGPVAGYIASWLQSILGPTIASHGIFAYSQSAAMRGYGAAAVNGIAQAWLASTTAAQAAYAWYSAQNGTATYMTSD